jgi:uncharacterized protein (TIGR00369 family)
MPGTPVEDVIARVSRGLDHRRRYGNPPHVLGLPLLDHADGTVSGEMVVAEVHLNPNGVAHGMVTFGILDNAMGQAIARSTTPETPCSTVDVNVQFLRGLRLGARVRIEAVCVRAGRRLGFAEARILDEAGSVCVLATGTYAILGGGSS